MIRESGRVGVAPINPNRSTPPIEASTSPARHHNHEPKTKKRRLLKGAGLSLNYSPSSLTIVAKAIHLRTTAHGSVACHKQAYRREGRLRARAVTVLVGREAQSVV